MAAGRPAGTTGSGTIRFVLDGNVHELENVDPTRTVLQFLREDLRRTGTKEGCAEGDCGACTVVLAELDRKGRDLRLRAINSCIQFLPTLDGKELITVESLSREGEALHPVQQAMLDCHGSQCGFCTPGFVMSLFALYKSRERPARRDIDDAIAGNLCRCTGYRPIVDAATKMYDLQAGDNWLRQPAGVAPAPEAQLALLRSVQRDAGLELDNAGRRYFAPRSADELAGILARYPAATVLAGGTDVGLWVTKQHRELETIAYVGNVQELQVCKAGRDALYIGAAITFSDALPLIVEHFPRLEELFLRFASPPIRNAATLGGNVANGSPIGDSMPALLAAGAELHLRSAEGQRKVPLDTFYKDYMVNDLQPGEFVEALSIPLLDEGTELYACKVSKRFDQDISAICGAFRLRLTAGRVADVRIAFGGMAATVKRAPQCEQALLGKEWNETTIEHAMRALAGDYTPISDMRATADYRQRVAANLLRRLYHDTTGTQPEAIYDYGRTG